MMPAYFLGIDGGQSATTAIIGDEAGHAIGRGRAGPSNIPGDPEALEKFAAALTEALHAACAEAGLDASTGRFQGACLGLSGGPQGREETARRIVRSDHISITHDAGIALTGSLGGEPGIVVIAGTGSIAYGRNAEGSTARAGGWGYALGDEGGGFWIARQALRAALRFEEGWGPPTALRARLIDATGSRSANHLMHRFYTSEFPRARIARLALQVNDAAESGDPIAQQILSDAARELVTIAQAVRGQLFDAAAPVLCSYAGGVFHSRLVTAAFQIEIARQPGLQLIAPLHDPAWGALSQAVRLSRLLYED